ncbi:cysteine--tRNA ligase [Candidatus Woesearchaeota archaeon]|nr:cysteine--tRNA ligase [Candidatus Woesearchaeota archaeon]
MPFTIYNTLTRKKEIFKSIAPKKVRMYSCGPTVYDFAHIGNFRAFTFYDLTRRYLKYKGYDVFHVTNLTDIDDKTIKGSQREKISLKAFTERYTKAFFEDLDALNIERCEQYPKATEYINEMVGIIKTLLNNTTAYKTDDGSVYFKIASFKPYGKLSRVELKKNIKGERVKKDTYEKNDANDFALWKSYEKEDGEVFWQTEIGKGRPGWHIECSAMSMKLLGNHFDLHLGGIDLIFPHHENEIAQSEACSHEQFVNYWMHNDFILVNGQKMSKSLGNFFTLRDLLKKGHDARSIRYTLLSTHYRQQLNFTEEGITASKNTLQKIDDFLRKLKLASGKGIDLKKLIVSTRKKFEDAMDDDLNASVALSHLFDFMHEVNKQEKQLSKKNAEEILAVFKDLDRVLGILPKEETVPKEIIALVKERETARQKKDWKKSDELRDQIKQLGYAVDDADKGSLVKKVI